MPTIYRKTAKGVAEIETRAHRLPPRARGLLILVDGKRDAAELATLAPQQLDETLAVLEAQGFIEGTAAAAPTPAPPPAPSARAVAAAAAEDLAERRRSVVRALNDALGPAAESMALKLERARTADELEPLIVQAAQLVFTIHGRSAGEAFAARFLPPGG